VGSRCPYRTVGPGRTLGVKSRDQLLTLIAIALTFGTGATDVSAFTRLGGVFTSVMTGNIVFFGLAAAERSVSLASHTAVAVAGYIAGVAVATWVSYGIKKRSSPTEASVLPRRVRLALFAELVLLAGAATGWEITGARPHGGTEFILLAVTAAAMGMQSAAVNELGFSNFSTTFLTGTLTWLVSSLARPGGDASGGLRRLSALVALAAGAGLSGLLVANAARAVPVLALIAMVTALVLARLPADRLPADRLPADRLPADRLPAGSDE
jgi:uncharacterized membrane protein YoaK (UPF0700 family)